MPIETKITSVVTKQHTVALTAMEVRLMVEKLTGILPPPNAQVYVQTPGGGDWSNCNLDIDADCPLYVEWTETVREKD